MKEKVVIWSTILLGIMAGVFLAWFENNRADFSSMETVVCIKDYNDTVRVTIENYSTGQSYITDTKTNETYLRKFCRKY